MNKAGCWHDAGDGEGSIGAITSMVASKDEGVADFNCVSTPDAESIQRLGEDGGIARRVLNQ